MVKDCCPPDRPYFGNLIRSFRTGCGNLESLGTIRNDSLKYYFDVNQASL